VTPSVAAGQAAPAVPLSRTNGTPVVTIGGLPAQILFSGLAPGFVGVWQINAVVPENAPAGDDIPVQVSINGAASNSVTMAVAQ
jgi:adhesin/invasin